MAGEDELRQLAHLLRTGAGIAAEVAELRGSDAAELFELIGEAMGVADRLDAIASRAVGMDGAGRDLPKPDRRA